MHCMVSDLLISRCDWGRRLRGDPGQRSLCHLPLSVEEHFLLQPPNFCSCFCCHEPRMKLCLRSPDGLAQLSQPRPEICYWCVWWKK